MLKYARVHGVVAKMGDVNVRFAENIEFAGDFMAVYVPDYDEVCIAVGRNGFDLMDVNPEQVYAILCHEYNHIAAGHVKRDLSGVVANPIIEIEADSLPASILGGQVYAKHLFRFYRNYWKTILQSPRSFLNKVYTASIICGEGFLRLAAALCIKKNKNNPPPVFSWCENVLAYYQKQNKQAPVIGV